MKIYDITVNHLVEPMGYDLSPLRIQFKLADAEDDLLQAKKQLVIEKQGTVVYQGAELPLDGKFYFEPDLVLEPRSRYEVTVRIITELQVFQGVTVFETGKMQEAFTAKWIGSRKTYSNSVFAKTFTLAKSIAKARIYMTGLGLYETTLDNQKIGDEYLTPGVTAYDQWVQLQTYDVTNLLHVGENHWQVSVADGWYQGNYGFDGGQDKIYGDRHLVLAELHIDYQDGTKEVIGTDESWQVTQGKVRASAIYYGEDFDATYECTDWQKVEIVAYSYDVLTDRLSLPIKIMEELPAQEILQTPKGETVIDFGQNQAGWVLFYNREPKGTKITIEVGEILQGGNFYRENLRHARAACTYISDGKEGWVRPHFTFYGYRYAKITGFTQKLQVSDFKAAVLYSEMKTTGDIRTENPKVNRLFQNILWGQKSNFLDVPTDCPQRDERLGWTGDADVFSNTAALNMDSFAFFKKYMKDVAIEQANHEGMVTMYAPAMGNHEGGAAVWGDAATIIPWNMYQVYGDTAILKQNYDSMKAWVDWISAHSKDDTLWIGTFQFGDWLALDGDNPALPTGKTEEDYIASIYYYYSSWIVAQTAKLLGLPADYDQYLAQAEKIKAAVQKEYITATGRLAMDTQTAYALALYFDLIPEHQQKRVVRDLVARLHKDNDHLKTGFVGTPFICQVLSKFGKHDLAMKIFMNEDLPSWLYAVNLGATTVWERWDSVLPDGSMNPEGMNSLNHYSIGAIMEWAYKYLVGIQPLSVGYQKVRIAPNFNYRLKQVSGHFDSIYGRIAVSYQIEKDEDHTIDLKIKIPIGVEAQLDLPRSQGQEIFINGQLASEQDLTLTAGEYEIHYQPSQDFIQRYDEQTKVVEIMQDEELVAKIDAVDPVLMFFKNDPGALHGLGNMSLAKLNALLPFINISADNLAKIHQILASTPILSERQRL